MWRRDDWLLSKNTQPTLFPTHQPDTPPLSTDATIRTAIGALAAVLGEDLKAGEIEVGVVRANVNDGAFSVLPDAEVDDHLVALSERD